MSIAEGSFGDDGQAVQPPEAVSFALIGSMTQSIEMKSELKQFQKASAPISRPMADVGVSVLMLNASDRGAKGAFDAAAVLSRSEN
jgi:hypothetical protein